MNESNNRGFAGFDINHDSGGPWAFGIGKLLINFGALEMLSYVWIERLGRNQILYELAIEMDFSHRIQVIQTLIAASSLSKDLKERIRTTWDKVSRVSATRNAFAHNPLVLGWRNRPAEGSPDYVGIPVLRKSSGKGRKIVPIVEDISKLDAIVDEVVMLAQKLDHLLREVQMAEKDSA